MCWSSWPQCDGFWRWVLIEVISVRWHIEVRMLTIDRISILLRRRKLISTWTLRKCHMTVQWEGSYLQAKREPLPKPNMLATWSRTSQLPELWENRFLLVKLPKSEHFVLTAWTDLHAFSFPLCWSPFKSFQILAPASIFCFILIIFPSYPHLHHASLSLEPCFSCIPQVLCTCSS